MLACQSCGKGVNTIAYSRHKKGSSGAGGAWKLRAPIHKRVQKPNLHIYHGMKLCSKCLKTLKGALTIKTQDIRQDTQEQASQA